MSESSLLSEVAALAEEAGRRILEIYQTDFAVGHKSDRTPVTEADLLADGLIRAGLRRLAPALPVISEETDPPPYAERAGWERFWLVDPLDGTREFVRGSGEFTVNIALIEHGRPVLGVIQVPVSGVSYRAERGAGAHIQAPGAGARALRVRPARRTRLTVARSRSRTNRLVESFIGALAPAQELRLGSSLKSCLVAEGRADVYPGFGPTCEWDTAAAQCLVEEAGGAVTDLKLQPLRYNARRSLENPRFLVLGDPSWDWSRFLPAEP